MPSTERRQRRIDAKLPETSAAVGTPVTTSAGTAVSPEIPTPVAPSGLTATGTYVVNSAVTPQAVVNLRWVAVTSPTPDAYAIQWALDSGFTNPTTVITAREQVTAAVSGLPTNRTVWFRIAARWQWVQSAWSASISTTTANDTTPSALPTGETATFGTLTGDLTVNWVNPTSANYRDIKIDIYNQSGGTLLRTEYVRDSPYVYSLDMNKLYSSSAGDPSLYLELRSRTFANVLSSTADTLSPTFATPAQVTGVTASANSVTGSLTFVYPSVATAIRYRLTLDGVARETTATTYEYTRALNEREHGGSFDTSIAYSIVAVDVFGQVSATATTGTATFGVPAQPSGVTADFSQPDCRFIWSAATDATGYRLSLDSVDRDLGYTNVHTYTLARNAAEHGGTADHTLSWSLVAYNVAGSSVAATGTVTSPSPVVPSAALLTAFFGTLTVSTTHTPLPTHRTYRYRITLNGNPFQQSELNSLFYTTSISSSGVYRAFVRTEDVFGRSSATEADSGNVTADTLTIEELRAEGTYTDSQTVNNVLTDGTNTLIDDNSLVLIDGDDLSELKDNSTTSSGVTYSAGTAWQNVTRFERPLTERYRTITAGLFAPTTNTQMYVSTSVDGSTWRWFAGPLTSVTSVSATLSEVISETAARAAPVAISSNATVTRWDLPRITEARYVRLHHRQSTGSASYVLYEFYPRRLVQSDDIEAESIKAINIAAKTITADQIAARTITADQIAAGTITATEITVTNLSSLSANLGTITAGTVTGAIIQTSAGTGARVVLDSTGLTTYNSSDVAQITATTANNGTLTAAGGEITLNADGLKFNVPSAYNDKNNIIWQNTANTITSYLGTRNEGQVITEWNTSTTDTFRSVEKSIVSQSASGSTFRGFVLIDAIGSGITTSRSFLSLAASTAAGSIATLSSSRTGSNVSRIVVQDTASAQNIIFTTVNTQRARIDANGFGIGVTPTARNNTTLQLANGIGFPATEVASSDANTLDDYSEGTWTPTVVFSGGTGGFTYDHQVGRYTKIGRLVHVQGSIQFDETAASGNLSIGGLPYSASTTTNNNAGGTLYADSLTGVSGQIMYLLGGGVADKQMEVYFSGTGSRTRITNTHTGTNTMFAFSICYHV